MPPQRTQDESLAVFLNRYRELLTALNARVMVRMDKKGMQKGIEHDAVATLAYKIHCETLNGRPVTKTMLDNLPWKTAGNDPEENTNLRRVSRQSSFVVQISCHEVRLCCETPLYDRSWSGAFH